MTTVIGIDPGSSKMGVAVWELPERDGRGPYLTACFALCAPSGGEYRYAPDRLIWLRTALTERIAALGLTGGGAGPVSVAWEHLKGREVQPAPALESCIVMLRQWTEARGWPWTAYPPAVWRQVVTLMGTPAATKTEVRDRMEMRCPALRQVRGQRGALDAVEAAAIGLHHAEHLRVGAVAGSERRQP